MSPAVSATPSRHAAVVGAGIAGLVAARRLHAAGWAVTVFEKSRGAGGRCATRRSEVGPFHHGVAGFAAHDTALREALQHWRAQGWVHARPADGGPASWVGLPTMNALARQLAAGLTLHTEHTVQLPQRCAEGGWQLATAEPGLLPQRYDALLLAVPAEQARPLCAGSLVLQQALAGVHSQPCWTLMLGWPAGAAPARLPRPAALAAGGVLAEVVDVSELPAATVAAIPVTRWVLHASAAWSMAQLELSPAEATSRLLLALAEALQAEASAAALPTPAHVAAHRWRYAQVVAPAQGPCGWDAALCLGSCGDAWGGVAPDAPLPDGVERAWLSGVALADAVIASPPGAGWRAGELEG